MRQILTAALALSLLVPSLAFAQSNGPIRRNVTFQNAATALANGSTIDTGSARTLTVQYVGGSGVITIEASNDNTNWTILPCYPIGNSSVASTFTVSTTVGMARCNVAGIALVRARISTFTSGTITATGFATSYNAFSANGF